MRRAIGKRLPLACLARAGLAAAGCAAVVAAGCGRDARVVRPAAADAAPPAPSALVRVRARYQVDSLPVGAAGAPLTEPGFPSTQHQLAQALSRRGAGRFSRCGADTIQEGIEVYCEALLPEDVAALQRRLDEPYVVELRLVDAPAAEGARFAAALEQRGAATRVDSERWTAGGGESIEEFHLAADGEELKLPLLEALRRGCSPRGIPDGELHSCLIAGRDRIAADLAAAGLAPASTHEIIYHRSRGATWQGTTVLREPRIIASQAVKSASTARDAGGIPPLRIVLGEAPPPAFAAALETRRVAVVVDGESFVIARAALDADVLLPTIVLAPPETLPPGGEIDEEYLRLEALLALRFAAAQVSLKRLSWHVEPRPDLP